MRKRRSCLSLVSAVASGVFLLLTYDLTILMTRINQVDPERHSIDHPGTGTQVSRHRNLRPDDRAKLGGGGDGGGDYNKDGFDAHQDTAHGDPEVKNPDWDGVAWSTGDRRALARWDNISQWIEETYPCLPDECSAIRQRQQALPCRVLMAGGDSASKAAAKAYLTTHRSPVASGQQLLAQTADCATLRTRYPQRPASREEAEYPIAFTVVMHTGVWQFQKLLHAIYQPQNFYCVHVDSKSDPVTQKTVAQLSACLPNVRLASRQETITYGSFSRLQADLTCMADLQAMSGAWRYVINLTGQEFPLKTNLELVRILKAYNGSNDIEGSSLDVTRSFGSRYGVVHTLTKRGKQSKLVPTKEKKADPPHGITVVKGSAFGVFTREFVRFVFSDPIVRDFKDWVKDVWSPDEIFWATINAAMYNPMFGAPGSHAGDPASKPWFAKYVSWSGHDPCNGRRVHWICIFGIADLPLLVSRSELFANKFHGEGHSADVLILDCLAEWLHDKAITPFSLNLTIYQNAGLKASS